MQQPIFARPLSACHLFNLLTIPLLQTTQQKTESVDETCNPVHLAIRRKENSGTTNETDVWVSYQYVHISTQMTPQKSEKAVRVRSRVQSHLCKYHGGGRESGSPVRAVRRKAVDKSDLHPTVARHPQQASIAVNAAR
eukprot:1446103-Rhodomonas_salina.1